MRHSPPKLSLMVLLLAGLLLAAACAPAPAAPDPVTVQLSWFHNIEFAGFYVAAQKGYYASENLQVTLFPGGPTTSPIAEVTAGKAQFGVSTGEDIIRSRAEGQDLVAVASIFRHNPLVVMALAESSIRRPQDLAGRTVGVISPGLDTPWDLQFRALLKAARVDPARLTMVTTQDYFGANELTSGRAEAVSSFFFTNEPVQANREGHDLNMIFYSDYGVVSYANPIFTTGKLIAGRPDLAERLIRATLKGYQYAIEHPDEAAQMTVSYDDGLDPGLQADSMAAQIPFIDTGDAPLGWMEDTVWQNMQEVLLNEQVITEPVDLAAVYTNQFVEMAQ